MKKADQAKMVYNISLHVKIVTDHLKVDVSAGEEASYRILGGHASLQGLHACVKIYLHIKNLRIICNKEQKKIEKKHIHILVVHLRRAMHSYILSFGGTSLIRRGKKRRLSILLIQK